METEYFTNSYGGAAPKKHWWSSSVHPEMQSEELDKHVKVSKVKLYHTTKLAMRVLIVLLVLFVIYVSVVLILPAGIKLYSGAGKSGFGNKEGLQWLGASTDVVRGDYENNQDSLAERALKRDSTVTDMAPPAAKLAFTTREAMTPEEELMKKQEAGAQL